MKFLRETTLFFCLLNIVLALVTKDFSAGAGWLCAGILQTQIILEARS
jgi:hypothetical protein